MLSNIAKNRRLVAGLCGLIAAVTLGSTLFSASGSSAGPVERPADALPTADEILKVKPTDLVLGRDDAAVTVFEYASLTCSHCAAFHREQLPKILKDQVETGKVRLVFRDFPLDEVALIGAAMTRCAPDRKAAVAALFGEQTAWMDEIVKTQSIDPMLARAGIAAADKDKVLGCVSQAEVQALALKDRMHAQNVLGVKGTPSFVINGKVVPGALTPEAFAAALETTR